jgi:hypothetical protein
MIRKRKIILLFAWLFLLIPLLHLIFYWLFSPNFQYNLKNFIENFLLLLSVSFNFTSIFLYIWLIELIFFAAIGIFLIYKEKYSLETISILSLIFLALNIISLIFYKEDSIFLFLFPLSFLLYAFLVFIYLILTSIRKCPFFLCKFNFFKPYFRHRCYLNAVISDKNTNFKTEGSIINISNSGGYLLTNTFINTGEIYNISFSLDNKIINLDATVVRKIPKDKNYKNGFGYKIIKINNKAKKYLNNFLKGNINMQIYRRPRLEKADLNIEIQTDEGLFNNKIYNIDEKGAYIVSNEKWNLYDKITGKIKINNETFDVNGKIIRLNDKEDLAHPKGFAMIFEKYPLKFKDKLKKLINMSP